MSFVGGGEDGELVSEDEVPVFTPLPSPVVAVVGSYVNVNPGWFGGGEGKDEEEGEAKEEKARKAKEEACSRLG